MKTHSRTRTLSTIASEIARVRASLGPSTQEGVLDRLALELAVMAEELRERERIIAETERRVEQERTHLHSDFDRKIVRPTLDQLEGKRRRCVALEILLEAKVSQAGAPSRGKRR